MRHAIPATAVLSTLLLSACATTTKNGDFAGQDTKDVDQVLMTPVNDIGLNDIDIPVYLAEMTNPYGDLPQDCAAIRAEVEGLDGMLGKDLDMPMTDEERRNQSALNASSATLGSVLIPFRGLVRAVSGASSNELKAREAYERGVARRAYLRGRADERDC